MVAFIKTNFSSSYWDELKKDAQELGVDWGWLWQYRRGFAHRVPDEIKEKIEEKATYKGEKNA